MKRLFLEVGAFIAIVVLCVFISGVATADSENGFDEFGYDRTARIFQGKADGLDGVLDGTYYGDPTYANDLINMKWNEEWDRGNAEGWANPPYDAHLDNKWNGKVPGGSGETWHYKFIWVGVEQMFSSRWREGGAIIWNIFENIFSGGTVANQHFFDLHATPNGFGNPPS